MSESLAAARSRVLFVDDEPRVLVALKAMFRSEYEVRTADGGAAALELLKTWPADVIVSDQRMPGMTGVEVLRAALELRPGATRVLLTGYSDLDAIVGSINQGEIFRFVAKPWDNAQLRETLAAAVQAAGAAAAVSTAPTPAAGAPVDANAAGVLVLDPDPQQPAAVARILGQERPVHAAGTVAEALTLLRRHAIGILITESVVDGELVTPLIAVLRQQQPALVPIVLTAEADAQHSIELINHGQVYRLLRKPVNEGVLRGSINLAARRHELLRQQPERARRITLGLVPLPPARQNSGLFARIRQLLAPG